MNSVDRPGVPSFGRSDNLEESIKNLDLGPIKFRLARDESPVDWTEQQIDNVEEEYRKFLTMFKRNPGVNIVPSAPIDTFWHFHILDTKKYAEDMMSVFNFFLHHFPYLGMRGEDDQQALNDQWEFTQELYKKTFGYEPPKTWEIMADCGRTDCSPGSDPTE